MSIKFLGPLALILQFAVLSACASTNPYDVPGGEGALLKNRIVYEGSARYSLFFLYAGGKRLDPDATTPAGQATYKIPSGEMEFRLLINYAPKVRTRFGVEDQYEINAVQVKLDVKEGQIYVINCKVKRGRAWIWLEAETGERVSELMPGLHLHYPYFETWTTLPDPVS